MNKLRNLIILAKLVTTMPQILYMNLIWWRKQHDKTETQKIDTSSLYIKICQNYDLTVIDVHKIITMKCTRD